MSESLQRDLTTVGRGIVVIEHKTNPSVQLGVTIVDGVLKRDDLISKLNDTISKSEWFRFRCSVQPKYRQVPIIPNHDTSAVNEESDDGAYVFVPIQDFDAEEVVIVDQYLGRGDTVDRHTWIESYLSYLQSKPMLRPGPQPFWRAHLGYTPDGTQTVFSLRIHHCLADGFTSGTFLADLMDNINPHAEIERYQQMYRKKVEAQSDLRKMVMSVGYILWLIFGWFLMIFKAIRLCFASRPPELLRRSVTEKKIVGFDATSIQLDEVNKLRKKFGATINDFFLAIVACTVRDLIRRHSELSNIPGRGLARIPKELPLGIPVDLRPLTGRFGYMGNLIGLMSLDAPLDPDLSFTGTLHAVKAQMDFNKKIPEALLTYELNKLVLLLPLWIGQFLADLGARKYSFGFSNVRAPGGLDLRLCGCAVATVCPFMPPPYPLGLGFVLCTRNDDVCFTCNVDENMLGPGGAQIVLDAYRRAINLARYELSDRDCSV